MKVFQELKEMNQQILVLQAKRDVHVLKICTANNWLYPKMNRKYMEWEDKHRQLHPAS